jgi:hypothetical protein
MAPAGRVGAIGQEKKSPESGALNWCRHHASNAGATDYKNVAQENIAEN